MSNKIKCLKCNDIIQSYYTHDFKKCSCGNIFIDGGNDYLRYGGKGMEDNSFEIIESTDDLPKKKTISGDQAQKLALSSLKDAEERRLKFEEDNVIKQISWIKYLVKHHR